MNNIVSQKFALELEFTETYRRHLDDDPAIREAYCLRMLMPHLFDPPQAGDCFVGRIHYLPVGFGLELAAGGSIYYCQAEEVRKGLDSLEVWEREHPEGYLRQVQAMLKFWETESTIDGHLVRALSPRDAERRLRKEWKRYAAPYLNSDGAFVRSEPR